MDSLHRGHLALAIELAPPDDPWMRDALAPYVHAVALRHAASSTTLGSSAQLRHLGGLMASCVPEGSSALPSAAGTAEGNVTTRLWEGAASYVRLCRACARLQDFKRSRRSESKFDALGVGGLRPLQGELPFEQANMHPRMLRCSYQLLAIAEILLRFVLFPNILILWRSQLRRNLV